MGFPLAGIMNLLGGGVMESALDFAKTQLDKIFPPQMTQEQKMTAITTMASAIEKRDSSIAEVKGNIMVAEMQQGDNFTKRARPSIIYTGLAIVALNYAVFPIFTWIVRCIALIGGVEVMDQIPAPPQLNLPVAFWGTWGGVAGVYAIGRTAEKKGGTNNQVMNTLISLITGNKPLAK